MMAPMGGHAQVRAELWSQCFPSTFTWALVCRFPWQVSLPAELQQ